MDPREQVQRQIDEALSSIKNASDIKPDIGIILGSGLGDVAKMIQSEVVLPYDKITHFPLSTVKGHQGNLILGQLEKHSVAVLQGRFHFYEGYTMWGITFPVRVLANLGVKTLIVTGACGGLSKDYNQGDFVLLDDHINLMPANPLIGPHVQKMGPRFIDMSEPYSRQLTEKAKKGAEEIGLNLKEGIYAAVAGPQYETRAEVAMLKAIGADVVGMSIVPEVIVAKQMGLDVLGLTVVSNSHGPTQSISHKEVLENVGKTSANFVKLLKTVISGQ